MIDEDLAEYALKISKADYTEVRLEEIKGNEISYVGELKGVESFHHCGFSIRIIKDGLFGFSFSNIVNRKKIREAIEKAMKNRARKKHFVRFGNEKMEEGKDIVKGKDAGIDEKIEYIRELDSISKNQKSFFYQDEIMEKFYMNSEGAKIYSKIPRVALYYLVTKSNGRIEQMSREFGNAGGWEKIKEWNVEEKLEHDAKFLSDLIKKGRKAPRKGSVILSPYITGLIAHESCGHPWEADRIWGREAAQAGKSFVKPSMLGKKFGNEMISVIDEPAIKGSYGYYKYDDEGIKARKRYLIKNGIINEFLHNRHTAHLMGSESNAAARAAYGREPIVRMANTYFLPGDYSFEEMIEGVKNGVYIKTYMEWNIDDMRYNQKYVGEEAYIIKDGEIAGIAYHPAIEFTTPFFYRNVAAVGKNLEFYAATCGKGDPMQGVPVTTGGVDIRIDNMVIK